MARRQRAARSRALRSSLVRSTVSRNEDLPAAVLSSAPVSARGEYHGARFKGDSVTVVVGCLEPLVIRGLADVLSEDRRIQVLDSALEGSALEHLIVSKAPRVAILGEPTPAIRQLRAIQPRTGLLVLAHGPPHAYGMRLLASGASCLARNASTADLLGAIHLTAQGVRVFVSTDGRRVERCYPHTAGLLTNRQIDVLEQLSEGRTNPEIAYALQISVETARTHVAAILGRLHVGGRRELIGIPIPNRPEHYSY